MTETLTEHLGGEALGRALRLRRLADRLEAEEPLDSLPFVGDLRDIAALLDAAPRARIPWR